MKITKYTNEQGTFWKYTDDLPKINGKRNRIRGSGFKTKKEAFSDFERKKQLKLEAWRLAHDDISFEQLANLWLLSEEKRINEGFSFDTFQSYKKTVEKYIVPHFGSLMLSELDFFTCASIMDLLRSSPSTFKRVKRHVTSILQYGIYLNKIDQNPMIGIVSPKIKAKKELAYFTPIELTRFLQFTKKHGEQKHYLYFHLLAYTGLRRSEALALRWGDIDFENHSLTVNHSLVNTKKKKLTLGPPKSAAAYRTLYLDDTTFALLKEWKNIQHQKQLILSRALATDTHFIFNNQKGGFYNRSAPNTWLKRIFELYEQSIADQRFLIEKSIERLYHQKNFNNIPETAIEYETKKNELKQLALPRITPHGFRYTYCSLSIYAAIPIKDIQKRLGHSTIQMTLDVYARVMDEDSASNKNQLANYIESKVSARSV